MKKFLAIILAMALMICFTACESKVEEPAEESEQTETELTQEPEESPMLGVWTVADNQAVELPQDVKETFDKAIEAYTESTLVPIAYCGRQVVSGTNYAVMCKSTTEEGAAPALKVAAVYADLEGNASLISVEDFNFTDFVNGEDAAPADQGEMVGAWEVPENYTSLEMPGEVQDAFDSALEGFTGNELKPMALLGSQAVAGNNYAILCHSELTTEEPVVSLQVVTVYADIDGSDSISSIRTIDIGQFVTY